MKALLWIRFRYLLAGFGRMLNGEKGNRGNAKKKSKLTPVLLGLLLLYAFGVLLFGVIWFSTQLTVFANMGLSWVYFSLFFLAGFALAVFGSVYSTQSQLYSARDNELLLAMPVRMEQLCLSRVIFLLLGAFGWVGFLVLPAFVVYWIKCGMTVGLFVGFILMYIAVSLLAQTVSCLLGWLLHLLLGKIRNKAFGSLLFMVLFLAAYFPVYFGFMSRLQEIIGSLATIGGTMADLFGKVGGPLVWLGRGAMGEILPLLLMLVLSALLAAAGYFFLIATYRHSLLHPVTTSVGKKGHVQVQHTTSSPVMAVCKKEMRRFLTCPIYLTNSGIGLIMVLFAGAAGVIFKNRVMEAFIVIPDDWRTLFLVGSLLLMMSFLLSTVWLTAPSVSLEGRSLWIPASLPLSGKTLLYGKLLFHVLASVPLAMAVSLVLGICYGLPILALLMVVLFCALSALLSGLVGLLFNLRFPRFDWLSEVYPCKQSMAVMFTMLTLLGVTVLVGGAYVLGCYVAIGLGAVAASSVGAAFSLVVLGLLTGGCWLLLDKWGIRHMNGILGEI